MVLLPCKSEFERNACQQKPQDVLVGLLEVFLIIERYRLEADEFVNVTRSWCSACSLEMRRG